MRPRRQPPDTLAELLADLRAARLLSASRTARLALEWGEGEPGPRVRELVESGTLTPYQAEQVLAGRARLLRLGPYHLLDRLGAGGMGQVYKARHRLMQRVVALKVLGRVRRRPALPEPGATGLVRQAVSAPRARRLGEFRREAQAAARLAHPNIVTAFDAGQARGRLFLVMEHVEGPDLARLLAERGPLPVHLACEVARQVALALQCVHERGLIHRDVKPANILLSSAAGLVPAVVKLLDFGLARWAAGEETDDLCGTMDYMAPERGELAPDVRSDLYSLGCTFYHLLAGQVPFPGGSWSGKLLRHRLDAPVPVTELRPEVPESVAALVARLMARSPEDRPTSPAEVVAALDALESPTPLPAPLPPPHRRAPQRWLGPFKATAAIVVGVLLGLAVRAVQPPAERATIGASPRAGVAPSHIVLEGQGTAFTTLAEAVAAAPDGATLTLHGPGPFRTPPVAWPGKALTLRAAPGMRPRLERGDGAGASWEALLSADRDLTLEGLELLAPAGAEDWPLVCVERGTLRLDDCVLRSRAGPGGPAVVLRTGAGLFLRGCRIEAGAVAISVQGGERPCRVRLERCTISVRAPGGAALSLWAAEQHAPAAMEARLVGNTIEAARVIAVRALGAPLALRAEDNQFAFRTALFSFDGHPRPDDWRHTTTWQGRDNRYRRTGAWLRVEGKDRPDAMRFER